MLTFRCLNCGSETRDIRGRGETVIETRYCPEGDCMRAALSLPPAPIRKPKLFPIKNRQRYVTKPGRRF